MMPTIQDYQHHEETSSQESGTEIPKKHTPTHDTTQTRGVYITSLLLYFSYIM